MQALEDMGPGITWTTLNGAVGLQQVLLVVLEI